MVGQENLQDDDEKGFPEVNPRVSERRGSISRVSMQEREQSKEETKRPGDGKRVKSEIRVNR